MLAKLFGPDPRSLLPVLLPEPLDTEARRLVAEGKHFDAVRLVRATTGIGLAAADRAVRALGDSSARPTEPPDRG